MFRRIMFLSTMSFLMAVLLLSQAYAQSAQSMVQLPTTKVLTASPGRIGSVNSFPAAIAISPDGQYAALLNDGYGTASSKGCQSIAILNLSTSELKDFPDSRLSTYSHQSYFLGLAFSSDGRSLYASVVSLTDPTASKHGDTGNGVAVYRFDNGKLKANASCRLLRKKSPRARKWHLL